MLLILGHLSHENGSALSRIAHASVITRIHGRGRLLVLIKDEGLGASSAATH